MFAEGGEEFFLVATVQDAKAAPREVKVEGAGLDATVAVGKLTIRFDGQKIVIQ